MTGPTRVPDAYHVKACEVIKYPELESALRNLPPAAHKELQVFLGYLQYKYRLKNSRPVARLGGLWADIEFDVTDDDVRALRQEVTRQLVGKVSLTDYPADGDPHHVARPSPQR